MICHYFNNKNHCYSVGVVFIEYYLKNRYLTIKTANYSFFGHRISEYHNVLSIDLFKILGKK